MKNWCEVCKSSRADYNYEHEEKPRYCDLHKVDTMVKFPSSYATCKVCFKNEARYNLPGIKGVHSCFHCKTHDMIITYPRVKRNTYCATLDCRGRAAYNFQGARTKGYCSDCKFEGMIKFSYKACRGDGCDKLPTCNFPNEKTPLYCKLCRLPSMTSVGGNRTCLSDNCEKTANFNYPGLKPGYCKRCSLYGMINVNQKSCAMAECDKIPHFNFPGRKAGLFCKSCKEEGMVNVKAKTCLECPKYPSFNYPGERRALYCKSCSKEGMISLSKKRCQEEGCRQNAEYNDASNIVAMYCATHKIDGMVLTSSILPKVSKQQQQQQVLSLLARKEKQDPKETTGSPTQQLKQKNDDEHHLTLAKTTAAKMLNLLKKTKQNNAVEKKNPSSDNEISGVHQRSLTSKRSDDERSNESSATFKSKRVRLSSLKSSR